MSAIPSAISQSKPSKKPSTRKSSVVRQSTTKPKSVQTAIAVRRAHGQSKLQISKELGIARNTVTSVLELNNIEQQIAEYRQETLDICPAAIVAVHNQVKAGDGDLGLRLLERVGVIGEDAIDTVRRNSVRQASAINILVQSPTVTVNNDNRTVTGNETVKDNYRTGTGNNVTTEQTGQGTTQGKQPKDGVGH